MNPVKGKSAGFSLIEVLVALVVLSIGLIGVAALFVNSLQYSGTAILRTRAVSYAEDMADRIRVNSVAGASYVVADTGLGTDGSCNETHDTAASACNSAALAAHDIYTWKQALASTSVGLPGGKASIAQDTTTSPPTYTIVVTWTERDETPAYTLIFQTP